MNAAHQFDGWGMCIHCGRGNIEVSAGRAPKHCGAATATQSQPAPVAVIPQQGAAYNAKCNHCGIPWAVDLKNSPWAAVIIQCFSCMKGSVVMLEQTMSAPKPTRARLAEVQEGSKRFYALRSVP